MAQQKLQDVGQSVLCCDVQGGLRKGSILRICDVNVNGRVVPDLVPEVIFLARCHVQCCSVFLAGVIYVNERAFEEHPDSGEVFVHHCLYQPFVRIVANVSLQKFFLT